MVKNNQPKRRADEVVFYSYPKLVYVWPLIAMGLLFLLLPSGWISRQTVILTIAEQAEDAEPTRGTLLYQSRDALSIADANEVEHVYQKSQIRDVRYQSAGEFFGWVYLITMLLVLLTVGIDIERNYAIFWLVVFLLFFFLGRWLSDVQGFTLFGDLYRWFADLDVMYDKGFGLAFAVLLAIPYGVMIVWTRLQHRWRITHNEFESYSFGRADDSLARGAKRVRSTYPDVLELLLCGAGTLIVYSATGRQELRRIRNIPLLPLKRRKINHILETTAVTSTDAMVEEEFEAEVDDSGEEEGRHDGSAEPESGEREDSIGNEPL